LAETTKETDILRIQFTTNAKHLTCHKFILDAEKDEKDVLQFDKELLRDKLREIVNLISLKSEEHRAYNLSTSSNTAFKEEHEPIDLTH